LPSIPCTSNSMGNHALRASDNLWSVFRLPGRTDVYFPFYDLHVDKKPSLLHIVVNPFSGSKTSGELLWLRRLHNGFCVIISTASRRVKHQIFSFLCVVFNGVSSVGFLVKQEMVFKRLSLICSIRSQANIISDITVFLHFCRTSPFGFPSIFLIFSEDLLWVFATYCAFRRRLR
jgi:hypothetical protein